MKNNENLRKMVRFLMILSLPIAFASCGAYVYYDDGIYGDETPRKIEVISNKQYSAPERNARNRYADYFHEKASKFDNSIENPSHFTDINSYNSNSYANGETYAGWGQNSSQVTVNVYDNSWHYPYAYGYSPYWRYNDFWGYGAWHYPYRSRVTWGFSMGWGNYYDPHWGWYDRYYGYRPYYYGYYGYYDYPYYYGGRYYPKYYYGNTYYGNNGRRYSYTDGRNGDPNRYENYNRSYQSQGRVENNSRYNRSYNNNNNNRTNTPYYENGRYRRNAQTEYNNSSRGNQSYDTGRSYDAGRYSRDYNSGAGNSSRGQSGNSGAGTTRRSF